MPDVLYGLGEPLLGYIELVGPILDLVRLQQADATSVLRAFVREIVWHVFSPRMKVQRVLIRRVPSWHGQMGHGGRVICSHNTFALYNIGKAGPQLPATCACGAQNTPV